MKSQIHRVKITSHNLLQFGFTLNTNYWSCRCPRLYWDKYKDDLWIFSESRGEPVRILPNEAVILNSKVVEVEPYKNTKTLFTKKKAKDGFSKKEGNPRGIL